MEIIDAEDERIVIEYMGQSRFLFREYQYKEVKECSRLGRDAESCYLIEYKGTGPISRGRSQIALSRQPALLQACRSLQMGVN